MQRFRLRFLLQEFDLVGPLVYIGRSPECQITIEDPLISRKHARVMVQGDQALVGDCGSRNGVRVNGRLIKGDTPLSEGDRIRIGTQELVFTVVRTDARAPRATGYMRVCASCGTPYPEGAPQCPHCGTVEAADEETLSGAIAEPKRNWSFQLLGEVIERALVAAKIPDAERLIRRGTNEIDERLEAGERLDPAHIATIAQFAVRFSRLSGDSAWLEWTLALHRKQALMLSDDVLDQVEALDFSAVPRAAEAVASYIEWYRSEQVARASGSEEARLRRLERIVG